MHLERQLAVLQRGVPRGRGCYGAKQVSIPRKEEMTPEGRPLTLAVCRWGSLASYDDGTGAKCSDGNYVYCCAVPVSFYMTEIGDHYH